MTRRTSEVTKTKSTVRPREIQRTVLNLERSELGVSRAEDAINALLYRCGPSRACTVRCPESARAIPQGVPVRELGCYCATPPRPAAALRMAPGNAREPPSRESLASPCRDQRSSPSPAGEH